MVDLIHGFQEDLLTPAMDLEEEEEEEMFRMAEVISIQVFENLLTTNGQI